MEALSSYLYGKSPCVQSQCYDLVGKLVGKK